MDITLHQLRCFNAVAKELHFARAAEAMRISPSTLSEQIATLERVLGQRLFERSARAVKLTPAGEELLPMARETLAAAERVMRWGRAPQESALNVGITGSSPGFRAILQAAAERLPATQLRLQPVGFTGGLSAVRSGEVDCALVFALPFETEPAGLRIIELHAEGLLVAVPETHRLASREVISVHDLWGETLIGPSDAPHEAGGPWHDWYGAIDASLPERCVIRPLISSLDETIELVAAGVGLNIMGASAVTSYLRSGIRFVPLATDREVLSLLVLRDERPEEALTEFVSIARAVAHPRGTTPARSAL